MEDNWRKLSVESIVGESEDVSTSRRDDLIGRFSFVSSGPVSCGQVVLQA